MQLKTFPFFHHPSTIVMVDDQLSFLQSMVTAIDTAADCKGFSHVERALEYLNEQKAHHPLFLADSGKLISPGVLSNFLSSKKRFQWVTTVIVDYTMPNMNGLEFCAKLKSPFIRKIMLTGDATLDMAVQAFNKGLIHKFFKKAEVDVLAEINKATFEAQVEYFSYRSEHLQQILAVDQSMPQWVEKSAVIDFVIDLLKQAEGREFYLLNDVGDFLLLDSAANAQLLMFRDLQTMEALTQEAMFAYNNEPDPDMKSILEKIKAHQVLLEPLEKNQEQVDSLEEWQPHLHTAKSVEIEGVQYFYAFAPVTKSGALYKTLGLPAQIASYNSFEGAFEVVG